MNSEIRQSIRTGAAMKTVQGALARSRGEESWPLAVSLDRLAASGAVTEEEAAPHRRV